MARNRCIECRSSCYVQGGSIEVPLEPLEQDVDKTPSEQPLPPDAGLDDLDTADSAAATPRVKDASPDPQPVQVRCQTA